MKIIKIEIHEVPNGYARPEIEMVKYPDLQPKMLSEVDTISYDDTVRVVKELYPLQGMALGNHQEWFYIREKDKAAFEEMIKGFTDKTRSDLLKGIVEYGKNNPKKLWDFILELSKEFIKDFI